MAAILPGAGATAGSTSGSTSGCITGSTAGSTGGSGSEDGEQFRDILGIINAVGNVKVDTHRSLYALFNSYLVAAQQRLVY